MKILDLFSGIGGFSLGLERAGMKTVAFCEIEEFPRKVLKKHWPDVPIFKDVRKLHAKDLPEAIDIICGGFPCQDLSQAGKQKGFDGERSSLYTEMLRLISECLPRYAIFENVSALLTGDDGKWFAKFLYDLASVGYDAEWHCISASNVGAPHHRDRVWIIAYPVQSGLQEDEVNLDWAKGHESLHRPWASCDIDGDLPSEWKDCERDCPDIRKGDGVPNFSHRIMGLGNAVVPQIPEMIGRAILAHENNKPIAKTAIT